MTYAEQAALNVQPDAPDSSHYSHHLILHLIRKQLT
jgi:hypothetical protein